MNNNYMPDQNLVAEASVVPLTNPELGRWALKIVRDHKQQTQHGISSVNLVAWLSMLLKQAERPGDLRKLATLAAAKILQNNWAENKDGVFQPNGETEQIINAPAPAKPKKFWAQPGLPQALVDLALALEKHGGEADNHTIKKETDRHAADVLRKYPRHQAWIDEHIKKTSRGVYKLA
jgi:hypothetical protein